MRKNIFVGFLLLLIPLILVIILGPYLYHFDGLSVLVEVSDWGAFGDYVGGILNPLLSVINILILIYISSLVSKLDDKRINNQFVYEMYKDLLEVLENFDTTKFSKESTLRFQRKLKRIEFGDKFLFGKHEEDFENICNTLNEACIKLKVSADYFFKQKRTATLNIEALTDSLFNEKPKDNDTIKALEELTKAHNNVDDLEDKLLNFIRSYMQNKSLQHILDERVDRRIESIRNTYSSQFNNGKK